MAFEVVDGSPPAELPVVHALVLVVAVDALQLLQLSDDVHGVPLDEGILGGVFGLAGE